MEVGKKEGRRRVPPSPRQSLGKKHQATADVRLWLPEANASSHQEDVFSVGLLQAQNGTVFLGEHSVLVLPHRKENTLEDVESWKLQSDKRGGRPR